MTDALCERYYHASEEGGITQLKPRMSEHQIPLVYFSTRRENVLVYLSNAVKRYAVENGFRYAGKWKKWATYGFDQDGVQRIEEYYPNALADTYQGVGGYIYYARHVESCGSQIQIPNVVASEKPVYVDGCERIPDAYDAILAAQKQGLIRITRYGELSEAMRQWLAKTIREEYRNACDHPEYRFFLKGKFGDLLREGVQ